MNQNQTLYRLTCGNEQAPIVETQKDKLLTRLRGLKGETVSVTWVTAQKKRRMKIVKVDHQAGTLINHLLPDRPITEDDF